MTTFASVIAVSAAQPPPTPLPPVPPAPGGSCAVWDAGCQAGQIAQTGFQSLVAEIARGTGEFVVSATTWWVTTPSVDPLDPAVGHAQSVLQPLSLAIMVESILATAGAAQVTATARLARTVWAMGPPDAVVTCPGSGTPYSGGSGTSPDCGYTYTQRSLSQRTAGRGTWPVTVTTVWQVTWTGVEGGAPVVGTQEVPLTVNRALPVGELQVLVTRSSR